MGNEDSGEVYLPFTMFWREDLLRLKALAGFFSKRKMVLPAVSNLSLFDDILKPRRLFAERQGKLAAPYFWGHRRNTDLDELLVEAGLCADLTPWRKANIAARHQDNSEEFEGKNGPSEPTLLVRIIESLVDCPRKLAELAVDDSPLVRIAVSENTFTDLKTMFLLAEDRSADVRYAVAENHNAPIAVLQFLSEEGNPYVAARAQRTLSRLINSDVHTGLLNRLTRKARRRATA